MAYISDHVILGIVEKAHPIQLALVSKGYSVHVDINVHEFFERHLSFDFTIFSGDVLIESFEFSAIGSEEELDETFSSLVAFVNSL